MRGDCSGFVGDCSGFVGDLDDCDISVDERQTGINISDLLASDEVKPNKQLSIEELEKAGYKITIEKLDK